MRGMFVTSCAAVGLLTGAAMADASDFIGIWNNTEEGGFLSKLVGSGDNDILRVVVTPAGAAAVRIHLYGRCDPECDWGAQIGHARSASPDSNAVESVSADFNTGRSIKHLTLRKGPGNSLRFSVVTDFTDHSGLYDYERSGTLRPAPALTSKPAAPAAPATAATLATHDVPEDCEAINPEDIFVAPHNRGWTVRDYNHVILEYGPDKVGAMKASRVLEYYRFDEQCYIVRPKPKMIYWRIAGQVPREAIPGEDCVEVRPQSVVARDGKVMDGDRTVIDFAGDAGSAAQAVSVIRTYKLNRQCFVARPSEKMVYWLSR